MNQNQAEIKNPTKDLKIYCDAQFLQTKKRRVVGRFNAIEIFKSDKKMARNHRINSLCVSFIFCSSQQQKNDTSENT